MIDLDVVAWFGGLACVLGGLGLLFALALLYVDTTEQ